MKTSNMFFVLALTLLCAARVRADISCRNNSGDSVYMYPGADIYGNRFPVAEFDGHDGKSDYMRCDNDYRNCQGSKYKFFRSNYDGRVGSPQGLIAVVYCN